MVYCVDSRSLSLGYATIDKGRFVVIYWSRFALVLNPETSSQSGAFWEVRRIHWPCQETLVNLFHCGFIQLTVKIWVP